MPPLTVLVYFWTAVHRLDAARLYRLALEKSPMARRYHAVADEGVAFREIAEVIGRRLHIPVASKSPEEAADHFGWFAHLAGLDCPATGAQTQQQLGWRPTQTSLIPDIDQPVYFESHQAMFRTERSNPMTQTNLGGTFTLPNMTMTLNRMGYGAMQLAGPHVWGPPRDPEEAVRVLREAFDAGVNHIDTSDYYGPHVTNQIIKQALHPYRDGLMIVTKVGARREADKSWIQALGRQELIDAVHDNLRNLGLDRLDVVNLRVGGMLTPS